MTSYSFHNILFSNREVNLLKTHSNPAAIQDLLDSISNIFHARLYRSLCSGYFRHFDRYTMYGKLFSIMEQLSQEKNRLGLWATLTRMSHYFDDYVIRVVSV